ncbi:eukaryotic translation initiation factor 3 subunit F-1 [Condylostylus longicornis]|uniref:eukaryotic translation initiation factor 3 subunit F-1 n=1 Tax=Condylostylus longicornis TaxID=2530218 RepID=UPI00244E4740|nr:eukaryotic translation initiation factor 3 subunit F-1 [Condylostylus longicornis]
MSVLNLTVRVHPVVLFQIVDAYERRNADSHRVIGTLLGSVDKGIVEVTNCFCVPHKEHDDQVEAELSYALDLYDLNKKVNANESIVGWWATGNEVTNHSSVIHEYYARECNNPIHLTVDTSLQGARMGLKAYVCVSLGVPCGKIGCMFTPINVEVTCYEPEIVGLQLCQKTLGVAHPMRPKTVSPMLDLSQIAEATDKLQSLLDQILTYVDDVVNDKQQPDNAVGRAILDLIHSVPNMSHEQFTQMFNSNIKDLLMVVTLSQLIKTQLQLNEKLTFLSTN